MAADSHSITGRYLSGQTQIPVPTNRRRMAKTRSLVLEGVATNNLKDVGTPASRWACWSA